MMTFESSLNRCLRLLVVLSLMAISAFAQHEHHASSSEPAKLWPGLSNLNHPVTS